MPASLLPDVLLRPDGRIAKSDHALDAVFAGWPLGHPGARLVQEYLAGRAAGALDISGRPATGSGAGTDGATVEGPSGGDAALPLSIVLDDADGALTLAVALTGSGPVLTYADSIAAEETARRSVDVVPAVRSRIRPVTSPQHRGDSGSAGRRGAGHDAVGSVGPDAPGAHPGLLSLAEAARSAPGPCRVILSAPKALRVLTEYLEVLAPAAAEFLLVGRDKHMSRGLNAELAKFYDRVDVSPGRAKSRLLIASQPRRTAPAPATTTPDAPVAGEHHPTEHRSGRHFLAARGRVPAPRSAVVRTRVPGIPDIRVSAFGACFGGPAADPGSELLLEAVRTHLGPAAAARNRLAAAGSLPTDADREAAPLRVLDLGCGNGWLLAALGTVYPEAALTGVDVSRAAIASAAASCAAQTPDGRDAGAQTPDPQTANPHSSHSQSHSHTADRRDSHPPTPPAQDLSPHTPHVERTRLLLQDATAALPWGTGAEAIAPGLFDLVVLNPPFHAGTTIETDTARTLIERAHELLAPGGRFVCVFNSHLRYRPVIERAFGNSAQWARDRRFTVVSAAVPA